MLDKIQELVQEGWHFECGRHIDDIGYYAIFTRRPENHPDDYSRSYTLEAAVTEAYEEARQWSNSTP